MPPCGPINCQCHFFPVGAPANDKSQFVRSAAVQELFSHSFAAKYSHWMCGTQQ
jgi:hypothetical protein